jgi:hypothetical protein
LVTLQQVMREGFPVYARSRCLPLHVHAAARALVDCGTAAMGGHAWACPDGHEMRVAYNGCRHRSCPRCAGRRNEAWLAERSARLLPCEHYHAIFTVPHELEALWFADRRCMVNLLFGSVRATLLELLDDERYLGARPGVIATLHTWGRTLSFHPHIHCLITGGGWSASGWKMVRNGHLLPFRVVQKLFRGKLLAALRQALARDRLTLPSGWSRERVESLLRLVGEKKWNVHLRERYEHGRGVLAYLGRYLRGGPLRDPQLVALTEEAVVFRYTDHRDGEKKLLALPLEHFVQRLTWHVPEPWQHGVRYWGLYARDQAATLEAARSVVMPPSTGDIERAASLARAPHPAPAELLCTTCGRALVEVATWGRGREPPRGLLH